MKLMDVLNEVKVIEEAKNTALLEARVNKNKKQKIADIYSKKAKAAETIATALKATKNKKIDWDASDDAKQARNKIVAAFMSNEPNAADTVIDMMVDPTDGYKVIEVLKALKRAHNGYTNLLKAATKAGKLKFVEKVYSALPMDDKTDDKDSEKE